MTCKKRVEKPELHNRIDQDPSEVVQARLVVRVVAERELHERLERRPDKIRISNITYLVADKFTRTPIDATLREQAREKEEQRHVEAVNPRVDGTKGWAVGDHSAGVKAPERVTQNDEENADSFGIINPGDSSRARC